jgi:hypothetical protein
MYAYTACSKLVLIVPRSTFLVECVSLSSPQRTCVKADSMVRIVSAVCSKCSSGQLVCEKFLCCRIPVRMLSRKRDMSQRLTFRIASLGFRCTTVSPNQSAVHACKRAVTNWDSTGIPMGARTGLDNT